jgi:putative DNA primase/helicase
LRYDPKDFRQRRPDGKGGWIPNLDGVKRVIYRWPEVEKYPDASVFLCEGEKDADRVSSLGHCATWVAVGTWTEDCVNALSGRNIFILEDNDEAGRKKSVAATTALHRIAKSIRIVRLPGLPEKGDVSDWLNMDATNAGVLVDLCIATPEWSPPEEQSSTETNDAQDESAEASDTGEAIPDSDLPIIEIKDGQLSALATAAEAMLIEAGVPLYQRGGTLVRPIIETVDASRGRKTKVAQLRVLDVVYMRDLMGRHATWVKFDKRSKRLMSTNPPYETAATVMARVGEWGFKAIAGVISAPTMRPDGSLLMQPGYDDATGLLLVEPPLMPMIPDQPTRENALAALNLLEGLLIGFPFIDDVAKSVALSGVISPVARGAFPVLPLHASRAPTAGSGKSFLWDIVAAIAIGQLMPVMSTGADTAEMEKRLGAAMMAGQPLISIDNISGELGGDALCQIIERPVVDIRVLGRSERVRIEARGTSTFASGNNFTVVGDLCRRVITANLDAEMERPEFRQFGFDPVERVLANRGAYIAAALTICRAYIVAGRPGKAAGLASFEGWSDTVRSALIWMGQADPVKSMESARAEDPERAELSDMLEAWAQVIGTGFGSRVRLADAILKGMSTVRAAPVSYDETSKTMEPTYPELYAAMEALAFKDTGKRGQKPDARMLGTYLRKFKGRIVNGKRFAMLADATGKKSAEWWAEEVNPSPSMETAAAA